MGNKTFAVRPFEKLKKKIENAQTVTAPSNLPSRQKKKEEYTEEELFSSAMNGVHEREEFRSLTCAHHHHRKVKAESGRPDPDREALAILDEIAEGQRPIYLPDTQEYVEWTNPKHHDTIIPMLHSGQFSIQAFLDLHGCTVPEAEQELDDFLRESFKKGLCCIKIIHGRGLRSAKGARIKAAIVKRLSGHYRKNIVAYVTARQCDGGLGALYVLLARK